MNKITIIFLFGVLFNYFEANAQNVITLKHNVSGREVKLLGSMHIGKFEEQRRENIDLLIRSTNSSGICMESDSNNKINAIKTQETVYKNPAGIKLEQIIGKELYIEVSKILASYIRAGLAIDSLSPYAVASIINLKQKELGLNLKVFKPETSMDEDIKTAARKYGKTIIAIEKDDAIIESFSMITNEEWRYYLKGTIAIVNCEKCSAKYTLNYINSYDLRIPYEQQYGYMKDAYEDKKLFNIYYKFFYQKRNIEIARKIEEELESESKCDVITIGIGHLGGEKGVVNLLLKNNKVTILNEQ